SPNFLPLGVQLELAICEPKNFLFSDTSEEVSKPVFYQNRTCSVQFVFHNGLHILSPLKLGFAFRSDTCPNMDPFYQRRRVFPVRRIPVPDMQSCMLPLIKAVV
ncbi:hypothetical protein NE695_18140, partial [Neglectibacter timonensis]